MKEVGKHPVVFMALDESDPEFTHVDAKGRTPKYFIETIDAERIYFRDEAAAKFFIGQHGMVAVTDVEMEKARKDADYT